MTKHKLFALLTALSLLLAMVGCGAQEQPTAATTEATEPTQQTTEATTEATEPHLSSDTTHKYLTDDPVLIARRETVEAYMRQMGNIIWRCEEDLLYTISSNITPDQASGSARLQLKTGRLYRGLPYTYADGSYAGFLDYLGEPDANGVYSFSVTDWQILSGSGSKTAMIGNDCSASVCKSWEQIGASIKQTGTQYMVPERGYLPVGDYTPCSEENYKTDQVCVSNGPEKMYEAYALLQAADGLVQRDVSSGHTRMVTSVRVVRDATGAIDPFASKVTIVEQTRAYFTTPIKYFDEKVGAYVYEIYGIDKEFSFKSLYNSGYLPITCKELIDPAPVADPEITDSVTEHTADTVCTGVLSCNWYMDIVTITLTDQSGSVVQQAILNAARNSGQKIDLQKFFADTPLLAQGSLDPSALASGEYRCTLIVRLCTGQEITVRDFTFNR